MEIQPMNQERIHGGGKSGRASVTCSPDSGGMQSRLGVIDTPRPLCYFSCRPKRAFIIPRSTRVRRVGDERDERRHLTREQPVTWARAG